MSVLFSTAPYSSKCFIISPLKTTSPKGYNKNNEPPFRSKNRPKFIPDCIICRNIIYQCIADVCSATFVRETIVTLTGRLAGSMEHLYGVLPKHSVSRLSLCAHYFPRASINTAKSRYMLPLFSSVSWRCPFALPENTVPPTDSNPTFWLLWTLFLAIGLPYFVVSTTAPLIQKWFANVGHHTSHDPYYLYAASNTGSLIALLSYPFLLEPDYRIG